jgi:hypothetical protein
MITVLAPLLVCALLVLSGCASQSGLGAANSVGSRTPATTATSSPMPIISTLSPVRPSTTKLPPLVSLHMINASTGWAFTRPALYTIGGMSCIRQMVGNIGVTFLQPTLLVCRMGSMMTEKQPCFSVPLSPG